jgi:hypothetical protein
VTLADTGLETMTGGRLRACATTSAASLLPHLRRRRERRGHPRADPLPQGAGHAGHRDGRAAARPLRGARLLRRRQARDGFRRRA